MIGFGMALTGACPGTVLVQIAAGVPSAFPVFLGSVTGGILYVGAEHLLKSPTSREEAQDKNNLTVSSRFKIDHRISLLVYETFLLTGLIVCAKLQPTPPNLLNPVFGGLAVGTAQLASVLLTGSPLGVSSAFEDIGKYFWWALGQLRAGEKNTAMSQPPIKSLQFVGGIMAGTYVLTKLLPEVGYADAPATIDPVVGFLGGLIMIFGARTAGGCTSGHGISGMAMLAVSSIISVASMFAAGIGLGLALYR
jgi:uncharacterized membrane protein YedE/YeeE